MPNTDPYIEAILKDQTHCDEMYTNLVIERNLAIERLDGQIAFWKEQGEALRKVRARIDPIKLD